MTKEIANYDEQLAEAMQGYLSEESDGGGNFLTTRGGILRFGEDELPGNQCAVIVLDFVRENTYYDSRFDPDEPTPPTCYAFGRREEDMAPHPAMAEHPHFEAQHDQCQGCPMNKFGSADQGRGKACKNRRRLAVIPAGFYEKSKGSKDWELELFDDPSDLAESEVAFLKLPVMSVKNWKNYVRHVAAKTNKPPFAVVTRVYVEPDPKSQFQVKFEMVEELSDDFAATVIQRHEEAKEVIVQPYAPPQDGSDD